MTESPFEDAQALRLFPTLVSKVRVGPKRRDAIEATVVPHLSGLLGGLEAVAAGQSWQSDPDLHRHSAVAPLTECIESAAARQLAFLKVGHPGFQITGCWANVNGPGTSHPIHSHPNNFASGVYYVQVSAGANVVVFHDPRLQAAIVRPPVTELTADNTDHAVVEVDAGTLLLFPAWLQHSVPPNQSDALRISVSFNLMFSRFAEIMSAPMWDSGFR